jgi:acyl carrier protein
MHKANTSANEAITMLRNWISIQSGIAPEQISETSRLVGGDILDSFALISLTSLVEELVGRPLSDAQADACNFVDLKTILERFFRGSHHVDA